MSVGEVLWGGVSSFGVFVCMQGHLHELEYWKIISWCHLTAAGGTFALYSLICRHAKVSLLPNQLPSDARISSFRLKVPSPELERSLKIKERLETSLALKKLLLMLVLAGTSMVIADGVVTPVMSGPYCLPSFFLLLLGNLLILVSKTKKKLCKNILFFLG